MTAKLIYTCNRCRSELREEEATELNHHRVRAGGEYKQLHLCPNCDTLFLSFMDGWQIGSTHPPMALPAPPINGVFTVYRRTPPTVDENYNPPSEPQFSGILFDDGTAAIRWHTEHRSTSVWSSMEELMGVHGHEGEYGTEIHWHELRASDKVRSL